MSDTSVQRPEGAYPEETSSAVTGVGTDAPPVPAQGFRFFVNIKDSQGFDRFITAPAGVTINANSSVFVSICELGVFSGVLKPFLGDASMEIHNVVPVDGNQVRVRGFIGWPTDLDARLQILVAN